MRLAGSIALFSAFYLLSAHAPDAGARTFFVGPAADPDGIPPLERFSGSSCASVVSDQTEFELCLDGTDFEFGDLVNLTYTVTNLSSLQQTYTLPSTCEEFFYVTLVDCEPGECDTAWELPRGCFFLETSFDLDPGESRVYEFAWSQHRSAGERMRSGSYRAWATLYWEGTSALVSVPFDLVPHGPSPIQDALDLASVGDTVLVAPGHYLENLNVLGGQNGVVLLSESGPEVTFLDGDGRGSVLYMRSVGTGTVVEGFTIRGGEGLCVEGLDCPNGRGGGVTLLSSSNPKIRNNVIRDNHTMMDGGGVAVTRPGTADLTGNLFLRNIADGRGGGVFCFAGNLDIIGNTFVENSADEGGGVYDQATTQRARVVQNIFAGNQATAHGAVRCATDTGEFCNAYWGNVPEDADASCDGLQEEVLTDPLFCAPELDLYSLRPGSPCLPESSPCGLLIGAYGEVCDPAATGEPTGTGRSAQSVQVLGPNPSRGSTSIGFRLPDPAVGRAELGVFDVNGRLVRSFHPQGATGVWSWDGDDASGRPSAAGVYWVRLRVGSDAVDEAAIVRLR